MYSKCDKNSWPSFPAMGRLVAMLPAKSYHRTSMSAADAFPTERVATCVAGTVAVPPFVDRVTRYVGTNANSRAVLVSIVVDCAPVSRTNRYGPRPLMDTFSTTV